MKPIEICRLRRSAIKAQTQTGVRLLLVILISNGFSARAGGVIHTVKAGYSDGYSDGKPHPVQTSWSFTDPAVGANVTFGCVLASYQAAAVTTVNTLSHTFALPTDCDAAGFIAVETTTGATATTGARMLVTNTGLFTFSRTGTAVVVNGQFKSASGANFQLIGLTVKTTNVLNAQTVKITALVNGIPDNSTTITKNLAVNTTQIQIDLAAAAFGTKYDNINGIQVSTDNPAGSGLSITNIHTGPPVTPLPVSLVDFNAELLRNETVKIDWSTASEANNRYFEVLRSVDGVNFTRISKIPGAGNSSDPRSYETLDTAPSPGVNYYRLVQYDLDGYSKLLGTKLVEAGGHENRTSIRVYPNPAKDVVTITFTPGEYQCVDLINAAGRILYSKRIAKELTQTSFALSQLPGGVYILRLTDLNQVTTSKRITKE